MGVGWGSLRLLSNVFFNSAEPPGYTKIQISHPPSPFPEEGNGQNFNLQVYMRRYRATLRVSQVPGSIPGAARFSE
jgi:hypothetical protein